MDLRGKGVLVTGASKGLGAALAEELAREGARVALVARGADDLARVAARIRASGGEAHALPADVADKRAAHVIAGAAAALVGPIELLVHNASTLGPTPLRLLLDTDCEDLDRVLEVNLVGPFRLTKIVVGAMALRGSGLVVHVSSDAAVAAYPRWGAYGVSKAALDHLGRIFAAELGPAGVRFLSVDPGRWTQRCMGRRCPRPTGRRCRGRMWWHAGSPAWSGRWNGSRPARGWTRTPGRSSDDPGPLAPGGRAGRTAPGGRPARRELPRRPHWRPAGAPPPRGSAGAERRRDAARLARGPRSPGRARRGEAPGGDGLGRFSRGALRRRRLAYPHRGSPRAPGGRGRRAAHVCGAVRDRRAGLAALHPPRRAPLRPQRCGLLAGTLPRGEAGSVFVHGSAARALERPGAVCLAALGGGDAVRGPAAALGGVAAAARSRREVRPRDACRWALRDRRSRAGRGAPAPRALRGAGLDRERGRRGPRGGRTDRGGGDQRGQGPGGSGGAAGRRAGREWRRNRPADRPWVPALRRGWSAHRHPRAHGQPLRAAARLRARGSARARQRPRRADRLPVPRVRRLVVGPAGLTAAPWLTPAGFGARFYGSLSHGRSDGQVVLRAGSHRRGILRAPHDGHVRPRAFQERPRQPRLRREAPDRLVGGGDHRRARLVDRRSGARCPSPQRGLPRRRAPSPDPLQRPRGKDARRTGLEGGWRADH